MGAATAYQQFVRVGLGSAQRLHDGLCGKFQQGCLNVFGREGGQVEQMLFQPCEVEHLTTRAFGALGLEERVAEQGVEQQWLNLATCSPVTIAVIKLAALFLYPGIQQDIARAAVEAGNGSSSCYQA